MLQCGIMALISLHTKMVMSLDCTDISRYPTLAHLTFSTRLDDEERKQCCQVKTIFLAQWPSKTSPKLAQNSPQIIIKLDILNVASDPPLPIKREMHFKYATHEVFT